MKVVMRFFISIAWAGVLSLPTLGHPVLAQSTAEQVAGCTAPVKTEKWFRRSCNDVMARECTAVLDSGQRR